MKMCENHLIELHHLTNKPANRLLCVWLVFRVFPQSMGSYVVHSPFRMVMAWVSSSDGTFVRFEWALRRWVHRARRCCHLCVWCHCQQSAAAADNRVRAREIHLQQANARRRICSSDSLQGRWTRVKTILFQHLNRKKWPIANKW